MLKKYFISKEIRLEVPGVVRYYPAIEIHLRRSIS
jgi:hypothetical protein